MKIYTSYFGNIKKLKDAGIVPICISLYKPKFFYGIWMKNLAPTYQILHGDLTQEEYIKAYKLDVLSKLNANTIIEQIKSVVNGRDVALCCYEKYGDFCHRHLVADWLSKETSIKVEEFGVSKEPKYIQNSLF